MKLSELIYKLVFLFLSIAAVFLVVFFLISKNHQKKLAQQKRETIEMFELEKQKSQEKFEANLTSFSSKPEKAIEQLFKEFKGKEKFFLEKYISFATIFPNQKISFSIYGDLGSEESFSGILKDTVCGFMFSVDLNKPLFLPGKRIVSKDKRFVFKKPALVLYIQRFEQAFSGLIDFEDLKPLLQKYPLSVQAVLPSGSQFLVLNYEDFLENYGSGDKFRIIDGPRYFVEFYDYSQQFNFYFYNKDKLVLWRSHKDLR